MSHSNGIITAPVSIEDVKAVLGESSNDLATLCKSKNINIFSIHKPIQQIYKFKNTAQQENRLNWEKGYNYDYGISKPSKYAVAQLYASGSSNTIGKKIFEESRPLTYARPNGSPYAYRLDDFDGYCHANDWSNSGMGSMLFRYDFNGITDSKAYVGDTLGFNMQFAASRGYVGGAERCLGFYDVFADAASYYPGLLFEVPAINSTEVGQVTASGKLYKMITAPFTLSQMKGDSIKTGTPYSIDTDAGVNLGTAVKGSMYAFALSINLTSSVWADYVGKEIKAIPCLVGARMYFKLQNEDSANNFYVFPDGIEDCMVIPFDSDMAEFTMGRAADNPYSGRYCPTVSFVGYNNLSVETATHTAKVGSVTFRLTNTAQVNAVSTFRISNMQVALYYVNSSGAIVGMASSSPTTLVAYNDKRTVIASKTANATTDFSYGTSSSDKAIGASLSSSTTRPSTATGYALGIQVTVSDTIEAEATGKSSSMMALIPLSSV